MEEWERNEEAVNGPKVHFLPRGADLVYINAMHDWAMRADGSGGIDPPYWDDYHKWQRGVIFEAKREFENKGRKAKTLEDLGYRYPPSPEQLEEVRPSDLPPDQAI